MENIDDIRGLMKNGKKQIEENHRQIGSSFHYPEAIKKLM